MTSPRAPLPRRVWSAEIKRWWHDFWVSEQGQSLPPSSRPVVSRLFGWYHRRELIERRVDRLFAPRRGKAADKLYSSGSMGQSKVDPLVGELRSIEAQIDALEKRVFGETPMIGPTGASNDGAALLAAANDRFVKLVSERPADTTSDPRLELLEGGKPGGSATA